MLGNDNVRRKCTRNHQCVRKNAQDRQCVRKECWEKTKYTERMLGIINAR